MSNGLKGKVREMVTEMDGARQMRADRPARDVSLREFIGENYTSDGQPLAVEHLFAELNIDPHRTRFQELYATEDGRYLASELIRSGISIGMGVAARQQQQRMTEAMQAAIISQSPVLSGAGVTNFLSPQVFLDPIMRGAVQAGYYQDLIVSEQMVAGPTVTIPRIQLSDGKLAQSNEAATIEEGSVTYDDKTVKVTKLAKGIKITYEAVMFNTLSLTQIFFADVGRLLANSLNQLAVTTIINGDQADGSETAAVIGVENTGNGITWFDLLRVAIQFNLLGRTPTTAIGGSTAALGFFNLPEVKNRQQAYQPLLTTMLKNGFQMPEEFYVSNAVPGNKLVLQDSSVSLVQLTAMALMVETEKIISKQIQGSFASIMTGFAKLQRNASVVIDPALAYTGNQFPSYLTPTY